MLKNKIVLFAVAVAGLLSSCQKEQLYKDMAKEQLTIDSTMIQQYIKDNKIADMLQDKTNGVGNGLFYKIGRVGAGKDPIGLTDTISVFYDGRILKATKAFDSVATVDPRLLVLGNLIEGWQRGIPHVRDGGVIRLIVPSKMAYINRQVGPIPANSILDFNISIVKVSKQIIKPINP